MYRCHQNCARARSKFGGVRLQYLVLLVAPLSTASLAHHSVGPVYDRSQFVEIEGEVASVSWRNPHIRLTVTAPDASVWEIETNSVSIVSRFGLTADLVDPGTRVRIAGNPSRAGSNGMWLTNMLLPDGQEILFGAQYQARWSDKTIGEDIRGEVTSDRSLGLFRVWTNGTSPPAFWGDNHPLTPAARAAQASYDPVRDDPTANCAPKGMPYVMEQPYPIELIDEGDTIVFKLEEYDTVRRIHMDAAAPPPSVAASLLGYSVGRWDGETLIVTTTAMNYPFYNSSGIPHSPESEIQERFWLSDDGSRLNYEMTLTDPVNFTEPVTHTKFWNWRPGEAVQPYNCRQ